MILFTRLLISLPGSSCFALMRYWAWNLKALTCCLLSMSVFLPPMPSLPLTNVNQVTGLMFDSRQGSRLSLEWATAGLYMPMIRCPKFAPCMLSFDLSEYMMGTRSRPLAHSSSRLTAMVLSSRAHPWCVLAFPL